MGQPMLLLRSHWVSDRRVADASSVASGGLKYKQQDRRCGSTDISTGYQLNTPLVWQSSTQGLHCSVPGAGETWHLCCSHTLWCSNKLFCDSTFIGAFLHIHCWQNMQTNTPTVLIHNRHSYTSNIFCLFQTICQILFALNESRILSRKKRQRRSH